MIDVKVSSMGISIGMCSPALQPGTPRRQNDTAAVVQVLPGDHTRPLLQTVGDVPPEFRQAASTIQSQGEEFLNRLSNVAVSAGFSQVGIRGSAAGRIAIRFASAC